MSEPPQSSSPRARRRAALRGPVNRRLLALRRGIAPGETSLGAVIDRSGPEGQGFVLLLLAVPTLFPIPGPVGMTFGGLIALLALGLMAGRETLAVPGALARLRIEGRRVRAAIARAAPLVARAEAWLEEGRLPALAGRRARVLVSLPVLLLAVAIMLPIPFGNAAPAIAVIAIGLGLVARDGLATLVGLVLSAAAMAITAALVLFGAAILEGAFGLATA